MQVGEESETADIPCALVDFMSSTHCTAFLLFMKSMMKLSPTPGMVAKMPVGSPHSMDYTGPGKILS
jgi:hypothetical protein